MLQLKLMDSAATVFQLQILPETSSPKTKKRLPRLHRAARDMLPTLVMTPRDMAILETVYNYRALTSQQIFTLLFPPGVRNRAGQRLQLLFHYGYLRRVEQVYTASQPRRPFVYWLDRRGAQKLSSARGIDLAELDWRPREYTISYLFLDHLLAINDIRIAIVQSAATHGVTIETWHDERTLKRTHKDDTITLASPNGQKQTTTLIPDGYFLLDTLGHRLHRFLEIDRATETGMASTWGRRDWGRKIASYLKFYRSKRFGDRYKSKGMGVLTVTTGEKRLANLKRITEEIKGRQMFWFTTIERLMATDSDILTSPIWSVATIWEQRALLV
jgi:Replication-relaxation